MRDIEAFINEYCAQNLPADPAWIAGLNRRFPKIASHFDIAGSVKREIADHLRSAYEAHILKGQNPENAWRLAQDRFGDFSAISEEIHKARTQSHKCLLIRFLAIIALIVAPLGKTAQLRFPTFFHPALLCFMAVCAFAGSMLAGKRDLNSLRKYSLYGAWIGLAWGIVLGITVKDIPTELGAAIALILLSTFYGLFLAAPASRGYVPIAMLALCHFGVLLSLARIGMLNVSYVAIDFSAMKMTAVFSIVSVLIGLIFFDVRKVHRRMAAVAAFGMVFPYMKILSSMTRPYASIPILLFATSLPPLIAVLFIFPIRKLQDRLLREAN
jgi:hypothetical protein